MERKLFFIAELKNVSELVEPYYNTHSKGLQQKVLV